MAWFKEPDFRERQKATAQAQRAAMEKFRAKSAGPAATERQPSRAADPSDHATAKQVPAAGQMVEKRARPKQR